MADEISKLVNLLGADACTDEKGNRYVRPDNAFAKDDLRAVALKALDLNNPHGEHHAEIADFAVSEFLSTRRPSPTTEGK